MSDPLQFTYESTPALWRCYYDPEGPQGFGKTKELALLELIDLHYTDDGELIVAGAIVAAIESPALGDALVLTDAAPSGTDVPARGGSE